MSKNYNIGVIVGRFQIDDLHAGHIQIIECALRECDRIIIFVGTSVVRDSDKNPLDYRTREMMLVNHHIFIGQNQISVVPLPDQRDDVTWSKELDRRIREIDPMGTVRLYGGRDSFVPHYKGQFQTTHVFTVPGHAATDRRTAIRQLPLSNGDFRQGVIYGKANMYPGVHPTIDVLIQSGTQSLLAKKPNENFWRFVGGFVDPTDHSIEQAVIREAFEETTLRVGKVKYICSARVDDWRYAKERSKIMTSLFTAQVAEGTMPEAKANDDIEQVHWFDADELMHVQMMPEHAQLMRTYLETLK